MYDIETNAGGNMRLIITSSMRSRIMPTGEIFYVPILNHSYLCGQDEQWDLKRWHVTLACDTLTSICLSTLVVTNTTCAEVLSGLFPAEGMFAPVFDMVPFTALDIYCGCRLGLISIEQVVQAPFSTIPLQPL
eukprot:Gb_01358 [translate_table: standard]